MFSFIWQLLSGIILFIILGFGLFYIAKLFLVFKNVINSKMSWLYKFLLDVIEKEKKGEFCTK